MKFRALFAVVASLIIAASAPVAAVPQTDLGGETIVIPFDPPLDQPLRYRSQKSDERDGKTTLSWSVSDFTFQDHGEGFRLSVETVSSGSNDTDPKRAAFMKKLEELIDVPYSVLVSDSAEVIEVEHGDDVWNKIWSALDGAVAEKTYTAEEREAVQAMLSMFRNLPAETRLTHLAEPVLPLLEFGRTEYTIGDPISFEVENESPFGGTITRDVVVSLTKVEKGLAHFTIRSSIPGTELEKLARGMIDKTGLKIDEKDRASAEDSLAGLAGVKNETVADYRVSLEDGMLESFQSTETTSFVENGKTSRRVKAEAMTRVR